MTGDEAVGTAVRHETEGWRHGSESNRRINALQALALPLGYRASRFILTKLRRSPKLRTTRLPKIGGVEPGFC